MVSRPSLNPEESDAGLATLLSQTIYPGQFAQQLRRLHQRFNCFANNSHSPLPARGLILTPEIRRQCEMYLPVAEISAAFNHLYRTALTYQPILGSTPFHNALSWGDVFNTLPQKFQFSANPARLLEELLFNSTLLTEFLFASFMPGRYYGGFERYPGQSRFVSSWLSGGCRKKLRCLDAACGTGEGSYALALLLLDSGYHPSEFWIEGWTIEPLETWSAKTIRFPYDPEREADYRRKTEALFIEGAVDRLLFSTVNLRDPPSSEAFDLILCNGLLGGPIIHDRETMSEVVGNLAGILADGGVLLAADSFHRGWKKRGHREKTEDIFAMCGLTVVEAGEGICGMRT